MNLEDHIVQHKQLGVFTSSGLITEPLAHDRQHDVTSPNDHQVAAPGNWGQFLRASPDNGVLEFVTFPSDISSQVYGDGSDGNVRITTDTTLSRDMYYENLTIDPSYTVTTSGYRVFVSDTCKVYGTIENNGGSGGNASGLTPGSGGSPAVSNSVGGSTAGTNGGLPITMAVSPTAVTGEGGKGGNGGNNTFTQGRTAPSVTVAKFRTISPHLIRNLDNFIQGGGGGAGGTGSIAYYTAEPVSGGGGGGGGGVIFIWAKHLVVHSNASIKANGGDGGDGAIDSSDSEGGGGGGSGGGGWCYIMFDSIINNGTIQAAPGIPGTGGGGFAAPGNDGTAGASGTVLLINRLTGEFD